jgi:thiamine biosynthesis lipoprotein
MRIPRIFVYLVLLPALTAGCGDTADHLAAHELSGATMGTTYNVKLLDPDAEFANPVLQQDIEGLLADLNGRLSTYRTDSELSQFNASDSLHWSAVSQELCDVVAAAQAVSEQTSGAFDITVGPLVNLWGFGPDGSISSPPSDESIRLTADAVGYQHLQTDCAAPAMQKNLAALYIDLSAYAKGYAVDRLAMLLDTRGVDDYLVEVGGELRLRGKNAFDKAWVIGIERPAFSARVVQTTVGLSDTAIATSGDYRNYFEFDGEYFSHTIDPRSGRPVTHQGASVTVVAESAAFADAMATALLVLGPEQGLEFADREGIAAFFQFRLNGTVMEQASERFLRLVPGR